MRIGVTDRVACDSRNRAFAGRLLHMAASGCAAVLTRLQISCVVLPVRVAPGVSGTIVDPASGKPVEGALVVVRFDGLRDVIPGLAGESCGFACGVARPHPGVTLLEPQR